MDSENGVCVIPKLRERIGMSGIQENAKASSKFLRTSSRSNYTSRGKRSSKQSPLLFWRTLGENSSTASHSLMSMVSYWQEGERSVDTIGPNLQQWTSGNLDYPNRRFTDVQKFMEGYKCDIGRVKKL